MEVDPAMIDVEDFASDGLLEADPDEERAFGSRFPSELLIPRDRWRDRIEQIRDSNPFVDSPHPREALMANYTPKVFDQHPESSCVLNASAGAIMRVYARQVGMGARWVVLSPMATYCQMTHRRHSGTYMWRALEYTQKDGMIPSSDYKDQATIFRHTFHENTPWSRPNDLPDGWKQTARHFRPLEWLRIDNEEQFGSSLLHQCPIVYGRSGHSMVAEDLVLDGRNFLARTCDSYGFRNRDGTGRIYDSRRKWSTAGAWALRAVNMPHDVAMPAGDDGIALA